MQVDLTFSLLIPAPEVPGPISIRPVFVNRDERAAAVNILYNVQVQVVLSESLLTYGVEESITLERRTQ